MEVRVDLANWALWTSPKFAIGVGLNINSIWVLTRSEIRKSQSPFAPYTVYIGPFNLPRRVIKGWHLYTVRYTLYIVQRKSYKVITV